MSAILPRHDNTDNKDNSNSESICNRKRLTPHRTLTRLHQRNLKHEKQEMQQTDCDIQRDQQFRATTAKHRTNNKSKKNNKAKTVHSQSSDIQMSDNNDTNDKMSETEDESNTERSSLSATKKREHNKNNVKDGTGSAGDNDIKQTNVANGNANSKKKVQEENESANDKLKCPVCDLKLDSQHTFTIHIRQHNPSDHSHTCRLCGKTLSSASSLDRHMLIHSGERPFKCRICNMAFTTNGNMHRHMRTHSMDAEEDNGTDSNASNNNNNNNNTNGKSGKTKKRKISDDGHNEPEVKSSPKRANSADDEVSAAEKTEKDVICPVCNKPFESKSALHSHMESHPNDPICCCDCGMIVNNYATYTQHRCSASSSDGASAANANKMNFSSAPPIGFFDLSFTDFTSQKFSMIAKSFCEHNLRKASSPYHDFECDKCHRAFPCGSALNLHQSSHSGSTYCELCHSDFGTPALLLSHQVKHRFDLPLHLNNCTISSQHDFMNGVHNTYGEVPHSDKEHFLALLDLHNKGSQLVSLQSNYKFIRQEDPFENSSYYIHAKPLLPRPTIFQPKVITNGADGETNKHDLADIQSIISVTSSATPLISSIRSSPPAASPASPALQLGINAHPDSPVAADSATASPNTPSHNTNKNDDNKDNRKSIKDVEKGEAEEAEDGDESNSVFKCEKCSLQFKSSNALKRHTRGHTQGGHSYACHLCPYTSLDKSTLVRHLRTHNGERPFQCAICKYAFTTKANCERHVKKRHKLQKHEIRNAMQYNPNMSTFTITNQNIAKSESVSSAVSLSSSNDSFPGGFDTVCKYCNVDFKFNRVLRHHLRSLHNSCNRKPYCCVVCKLGFSTKNNCIRHVVKQHPDMKDKLSKVVIVNANSATNSDQSEAESVYQESSKADGINTSADDSLRSINIDSESPLSGTHSSLAALCQIARNISANNDNPLDLANESNKKADANGSFGNSFDDQPLNLANQFSEEQPLDLAVHALDLSCKSSVRDKSSADMKNMNEAVRNAASSLLALRSFTANTAFPSSSLLTNSSLFNPRTSLTPPLPAHSSASVPLISQSSFNSSTDDIYKVTTFRISKNRLMPRNERSFTCVYCSAGFTLKSNMERHIKRKHPEFARPPRNRGASNATQQTQQQNATSSSLLSKSNNPTLSSKTRAALRVVLSNKVMGSSTRSSSPIALTQNNNESKKNDDNNNTDNMNGDLASVSSLIDHSANSSNALKQYFDKTNEDIDSNADAVNELKATPNDETVRPNNANKSEKLFRKKGNKSNDNNNNSSVVIKKRSAYTDSPNSVSCPYCSRKFPWTSSLRRHILTHTGLKPYKCPKCPILFTTKSNCERHLIRKHNGREKRNVEMQTTISCSEAKQYKCNICPNSTFSTQGNLRKHFYLRHWTKSGKAINAMKSKKDNETHETNATIPKECESDEQQLSFKCYICEESLNGRFKCLSHIQSCHSSEYETLQSKGAVDKVPISDAKIIADTYADDYEQHNNDKIYCVFCPRQFLSIENLRRHMRVHLGERPFKCTLCTKKFSLKNSLLRHYRTNHPESAISAKSKAKLKQQNNRSNPSPSADKESEAQTPSKAAKAKGSCNSLLYLMPKDNVTNQKQSDSYFQSTNTSTADNSDGNDLIQNLLGIDSKMIDEMLDSADSAARILGVRDAL